MTKNLEQKGMSKMNGKKVICAKRGRFLCTLEKGHTGPHGRQYRRDIKAEKTTASVGCACHQGGKHTSGLD